MDNITRICLWSGPRNISTALMYAFAQREDTKVYDEPLYAHYLSVTDADSYHPGASEILATMENSGEKVVQMMLEETSKPVLFFKNMTHHLTNLDISFLKDVHNIILTRDPKEMIPSFDKVIESPSLRDVGYDKQAELVTLLTQAGITPIVIDSKKVQNDPEGMLSKLCETVGIPFNTNMLHWEAGARPEDGIWAPYWYGNVHKSTGFQPYKAKKEAFPERLLPLLETCLPLFETIKKYELT